MTHKCGAAFTAASWSGWVYVHQDLKQFIDDDVASKLEYYEFGSGHSHAAIVVRFKDTTAPPCVVDLNFGVADPEGFERYSLPNYDHKDDGWIVRIAPTTFQPEGAKVTETADAFSVRKLLSVVWWYSEKFGNYQGALWNCADWCSNLIAALGGTPNTSGTRDQRMVVATVSVIAAIVVGTMLVQYCGSGKKRGPGGQSGTG
eukprot:TRINITY_DN1282_c0_g1_i1.p1 TRINITY_DN1282_c0_g1~~TRINITY_DN1282_c0_g1_i1.p1  ORF type:complete len:221 (+),score=10.88 TRINITY_DN1282_c0_g1_i1:59-664(+)